jgi:hypothetical protein
MDGQDWWKGETDRHHAMLMQLLALIFVYAGLADDTRDASSATDRVQRAISASQAAWTLPRRVHRMLLLLLRPVEAATRRLIVVLASRLPAPSFRGRVAEPGIQSSTADNCPQHPTSQTSAVPGSALLPGNNEPAEPSPVEVSAALPQNDAPAAAYLRPFALVDPAKRYDWLFSGQPHGAGWQRPEPSPPEAENDELAAGGMLRRVAALARTLEDLPAQAQRLARWRARRIAGRAAGKHVGLSPLRPGLPPGSPPRRAPKKARRAEHDLLAEVHALAWQARFDTS